MTVFRRSASRILTALLATISIMSVKALPVDDTTTGSMGPDALAVIFAAHTPAKIDYSKFSTATWTQHESGLARREKGTPGKYSLRWSRVALKGTRNQTLLALPVRKKNLQDALQNALEYGAKKNLTDYRNRFVSSTANLSLVVQSTYTLPMRSFAWQDYIEVASILSRQVGQKEGEITTSLVGVVFDPTGVAVADVGVIPDYLVETVEAQNQSSSGTLVRRNFTNVQENVKTAKHPPAASPPRMSRSPDKPTAPLLRRATVGVANTTYSIALNQSERSVPRSVLWDISRYASDAIALTGFQTYANIIALDWTNSSSDAVFSFETLGDSQISGRNMKKIMPMLLDLVDAYVRYQPEVSTSTPAPALEGRILDQSGTPVALCYIGRKLADRESPSECQSLAAASNESYPSGCLVAIP